MMENDEIKKILETMQLRFTSGNSIPVERALIKKDEWDKLTKDMAIIPRHFASNINTAAAILENNGNILDRREAEVLRKLAEMVYTGGWK
jgi:hypothetical protein